MRLSLLLVALAIQLSPSIESLLFRLERGRVIHERPRRMQEVPTAAAPVCSDPGIPSNGHRETHNGGSLYKVGDEVFFRCYDGYTLEGQSLITCILNLNGTASWDFATPQCIGKGSQDSTRY